MTNEMKFEFEKAGRKVAATINEENIAVLTVEDYSCEVKTDNIRDPQGKRVWVYEVTDKNMISLFSQDKPKTLYLSDLSAKEIFYEIIDRKDKEKKMKEEAEINAIKSGETKIKVGYRDGEYLSGYSVRGLAAKLLIELKVAHEVSGWGIIVDDELVKELGEEFTYEQAKEFASPKLEEVEQQKAKEEADRQAKFNQARETSKPVILEQWTEPCNDPQEDCNLDSIVIYAMPDGSTKETRSHTW